MTIRIWAAAVLSVPAFYLAMRYNMHMFQLNGYKNGEQISWLKKNIRQQWLLVFGMAVGLLRLFFRHISMDILCLLTLLLIILVYRAMRRLHAKKKFVYTARVKRMIVTDLALTAALLFLAGFFGGMGCLPGAFLLLASAQLFADVVVNVINHPIEMAVNRHYINDARRRLREMPDLTVIGVTGSYGKTSVKFYLQTLLREEYNVLVTPESFNTPMGVVRTIRESLKPEHEIFVCEMGARHVGDIKEVCDIARPTHGVITSIGPQHLETFFTMENIQSTKFELADALPEGGMLFLNGDNPYIREKAAGYNSPIFYCTGDNGEVGEGYRAKDIKVSQLGTEFTVDAPDGGTERFQMHLIGAHNVINVVGAIAVAHELGISLERLRIPVRRLLPVEHRMQMREHGLVTVIDDSYNSNPVGSKAAVETLAMFEGIRILVTPGMVELGEKEAEFNYKFGTYAAACCDYILLVGRRHTQPIREGVMASGFPESRCRVFDKLEEATSYAYSIKGQGHKYILLENDLPDNY